MSASDTTKPDTTRLASASGITALPIEKARSSATGKNETAQESSDNPASGGKGKYSLLVLSYFIGITLLFLSAALFKRKQKAAAQDISR
jgi:hypothetical protein